MSASKSEALDMGTSPDEKPGSEPKSILASAPPKSMGMSKKEEGMTPSPVLFGISKLGM